MDTLIRRIEEQIGRLKLLDIEALKARWDDVTAECRAAATPSYKNKGTMSYNGWTREGAQLVRDVSEAVTFERVLGIVGADTGAARRFESRLYCEGVTPRSLRKWRLKLEIFA
jgi:hypothetical protein